MCQVNKKREKNILGEEEDQIGREPIRWRRRRKEKGKEKKEEIKEKEKKKGKRKEKEKKGTVCERVRKKRWREERKKKEKKKGMTLFFVISDKPAVETPQGKRQSWSTQQELRVGTEIRIFRRSNKR